MMINIKRNETYYIELDREGMNLLWRAIRYSAEHDSDYEKFWSSPPSHVLNDQEVAMLYSLSDEIEQKMMN